MAKRYHKSSKGISHHSDQFNDEMKHDKGTDGMGFSSRIADAANKNEFYAGMPARRRQELEDAGMIHEDSNAIANLPQNVMIKAYPKTGPYNPEGLEDSIIGVDDQMDYDDSQRAKHFFPKKM